MRNRIIFQRADILADIEEHNEDVKKDLVESLESLGRYQKSGVLGNNYLSLVQDRLDRSKSRMINIEPEAK